MFKKKTLFTFSLGLMIPVGLLVSPDTSFAQKYRVILPPRPQQPPALNNTVQAQIANQNVNFNTSNSISGGGVGGVGGGAGAFNANSGGISGTGQFTQNNSPGSQISALYGIPLATGGAGGGQGGGGFGQAGGGFGQGGGGGGFGQG